MPEAHLNITGDSSSAVAAVAEVKAAIDSLHGKTVDVNVRVNESGSGLSGLAAAHEKAAASARDHANAEDRAAASSRDAAHASDRAATGARDHASASDRAAASARDHADATDRVAESGQRNATFSDRAASGIREQASASDRAAQSSESHAAAAAKVSQWMSNVGPAANRAGSSMESYSSSAFHAGEASSVMSTGIGKASRTLSEAGSSASKASKDVSLFSSISEGMNSLGTKAEESLSGMSGAARGVGMGALYATAGISVLTAATSAIGVAGVVGDIAKSGPLMNEARSGIKGFMHEFSAMSGASAAAGLGPMKGLAATAKELGHELAAVGVANMGGVLGGASQLVGATTAAISKLEPAIGPATTAATALGKAVIGAFGNSGPAITSFANTVTANAPGIQAGLEGVVKVAGQVGEVVAKAAGNLGPGIGSDSGFTVAGGIGGFLKSIAPQWMQNASDAVDKALGVQVDSATGNVWAGGGPAPSRATGFGTGAASTPHAEGPKPGATDASGAPRDFAPGEFRGQSFGWHMPAGAPPIVAGQSNDMSSVVSDMSGSNSAAATQPAAPKPAEAPKAPEAPPPPPADSASSPPPLTGIGSGGSSGPTIANAQAVTAALNTVPPAMAAVGSASATMGSQVGASMGAAATSAQSSSTDVSKSMNSVQQTAAAPAPPPPPPAAPPPPPPPLPPPAAPAPAAVKAAVASAAPAAAAGGADVGAAAGEGTGVGLTKSITNTLTIMKKWIVKIIDVGMSGLDAHSPSRVFAKIGASIPQGMEVGINAEASKAVSATQAMVGKVVSAGQTQLAGAQAQTAKAAQAGLTAPINSQPGMGGRYGAQTDAQKKAEEQKQQDRAKADNKAASEAERRTALGKLGYNQSTIDRIVNKENAHNERAKALREGITRRNTDAIDRSLGKDPSQRDPNGPSAWDQRKGDILGRAATNKTTAQNNLSDKNWDAGKATRDAQQQGRQIGAGLPQGMTDGINQNSGQPEQASTDMAGKAIDAAKKKTKSKSPSQVFHDIGRGTAEGMSNGMSAGMASGLSTGADNLAAAKDAFASGMADTALRNARALAKRSVIPEDRHLTDKQVKNIYQSAYKSALMGADLVGMWGSGVEAASNGVMPVASSRGLMVGYVWARGVASGADKVLKKADFVAASIPQIDSALAKTALGAAGLLGPAGSGAQIYKAPMVTMGGASSSAPAAPQVHNWNLFIDGKQVRVIAREEMDSYGDQLVSSISRQSG